MEDSGMKKTILALILVCIWPVLATESLLAATGEEQAALQKHVEAMRFKSPGKYQEMVQRAGGNVTGCLSCHVEVAEQGRKFGRK